MAGYIPHTKAEWDEMLDAIGVDSIRDLYKAIPDDLLVDELDIPHALSQLEVERYMAALADRNTIFSSIFRGAGSYNHYIPPVVRDIPAKETFLTAYTPYQAEVSQGVLQAIFEYQTMISELTGLPVANASLYDGAQSAAEACAMARTRNRTTALVSATVDPQTLATIRTYSHGAGVEVIVVGEKDGRTDLEELARLVEEDESTSSFIVQQPNFHGLVEDTKAIGELLAESPVAYIMSINPIAAMLYASPGEVGADIACGEGQPLGMPLSFGGPYLGFLASTEKLTRKIPGRIIGQTVDRDGKRSFVLTLQAREQHIRREKATSNVCTNQALCALTASVYMATMGPGGMKAVAEQCHAKAAYAREQLTSIPGVDAVHEGEFFHEFVTTLPVAAEELESALAEKGILSGLPVEDGMLWCVTEMNTKEDIDALVEAVRGIVGEGR